MKPTLAVCRTAFFHEDAELLPESALFKAALDRHRIEDYADQFARVRAWEEDGPAAMRCAGQGLEEPDEPRFLDGRL
jgi:hypothetical protein